MIADVLKKNNLPGAIASLVCGGADIGWVPYHRESTPVLNRKKTEKNEGFGFPNAGPPRLVLFLRDLDSDRNRFVEFLATDGMTMSNDLVLREAGLS